MTREEIDKKTMTEMGITDRQLEWFLSKATRFIGDGGGSFRNFQERLGIDYGTAYLAGGMEFTNALWGALHGDGRE